VRATLHGSAPSPSLHAKRTQRDASWRKRDNGPSLRRGENLHIITKYVNDALLAHLCRLRNTPCLPLSSAMASVSKPLHRPLVKSNHRPLVLSHGRADLQLVHRGLRHGGLERGEGGVGRAVMISNSMLRVPTASPRHCDSGAWSTNPPPNSPWIWKTVRNRMGVTLNSHSQPEHHGD
jgi:hypothetical protein